MIFSELDNEASPQRYVQLSIDDPLQYFFSFDFQESPTSEHQSTLPSAGVFSQNLIAVVPPSLKYITFPTGVRNELFLRIENLGDKFDSDRQAGEDSIEFKLDQYARNLYAQANIKNPSVTLKDVNY